MWLPSVDSPCLDHVVKGFFEWLVELGNVDGLLFLDEAGDELVIEHVQLQEHVVHNLVVFDLQVQESERLHSLHDFAEHGRRQ